LFAVGADGKGVDEHVTEIESIRIGKGRSGVSALPLPYFNDTATRVLAIPQNGVNGIGVGTIGG